MAADQAGGDAAMGRVVPLSSSPAAAAAAAAASAARMLAAPRLPPVGSAVPLVILPVMRASRLHVGGGGGDAVGGQQPQQPQQQQQQQQQQTRAAGRPAPRLDAHSLPAPGAWVKLRHLALQVAPGGELQLLHGTPSKMSLVPAPGSAGDGAAPHLELRLAARLAAGEPAAWASAGRGGARVASLADDEVAKAVARAREIDEAVRAHPQEAAAAAGAGGEGEDEGEDEDEAAAAAGGGGGGGEDGENAPPPQQQQQPPQKKKRSKSASTTTTTTTGVATASQATQQQQQQQLPPAAAATPPPPLLPLVTLRQLLSARSRRQARADAAALAARDAADGFAPRRAYFARSARAVVRVASLRPADLVQWARPVPAGNGAADAAPGQRQQQWALCGRAALADGTVTAAASATTAAVLEAFVAPETSEALLGVDAGPLDGRDARSRDRLARLAASVARLQAVGPAPPQGRGGEEEGGAAGADDADERLLLEPTAWVEALLVPRVRLPAAGGDDWRVDFLLTGARLRSEAEVEAERSGGGQGGAGALASAVRDAVAEAQREAARRRAGGAASPAAAAGRREPAEGEDGEGGGGGKRRRRG